MAKKQKRYKKKRAPMINSRFSEDSLKKEIEELEKRKIENASRAAENKGFLKRIAGFSQTAQINKAINERKQILGARRRIEITKLQTELEVEKSKLKEARKKSAVNFEDLYKY